MSNAKTKSESNNQPLTAAQQKLVADGVEFAKKLSRKFRPPAGLDVGDLEQIAMMGLITAARRYDPSRGIKFTTFANAEVCGQIIAARNSSGATHVPPRAGKGSSGDRLERLQALAAGARFALSLNLPLDVDDVDSETIQDTLESPDPNAEESMLNRESIAPVLEAFRKLDEDQKAFFLALAAGGSVETVARELRIPRVTAWRWHRNFLNSCQAAQ